MSEVHTVGAHEEDDVGRAPDLAAGEQALSRKASEPEDEPRLSQATLLPSRSRRNTEKSLPPTPATSSPLTANFDQTASPRADEPMPSIDGRPSQQSIRPSSRDLYSAYQPKVKVGPRPSIDSVGRSNSLDIAGRANQFRPISTLPASVRMPARKAVPTRPKSQHAQASTPNGLSSKASHTSPTPNVPSLQIDRPHPGVVHFPPASPHINNEPKSPGMTPEKRRLMKALQIRQKQMAAARRQAHGQGISPPPSSPAVGNDELVQGELPRSGGPSSNGTSKKDVDRALDEGGSRQSTIVPITEDQPEAVPMINSDVSPISVWEGKSTQPSSITDSEDTPTQNIIEAMSLLKDENETQPGTDSQDRAARSHHLVQAESWSSEERPSNVGSEDVNETAPANVYRGETQRDSQSQEVDATESPLNEPIINFAGHGKDGEPSTIGKSETLSDEQTADSTTDNTKSGVAPARETQTILVESNSKDTPNATASAVGKSETSAKAVSPTHVASTPEELPYTATATNSIVDFPVSEKIESNSRSLPVDVVEEQLDEKTPPTKVFDAPPPAAESLQGQNISVEYKEVGKCGSVSLPDQPSTTTSSVSVSNEKQKRRKGVIQPLERSSSAEISDEHFLSDDSFMEELKSATVQEAKPISVSKSPITPVFPRSSSSSDQRSEETAKAARIKATRSVSSPLDGSSSHEQLLLPSRVPTPVSPGSYPASPSPPIPALPQASQGAKKTGVSSGITQRIKALEKLSSRPSSPSQVIPAQPTPGSGSSFISFRKSSFRTPPKTSDGIPLRTNESNFPVSHPPTPSIPPTGFSTSPEGLVNYQVTSKSGKSRPESISVTAKIVRDPRKSISRPPSDPSEIQPLDLHRSPLMVRHQPADDNPPESPLRPPNPRFSSAKSCSSSSTEAPPSKRRDSFASRRSMTSRRGSEVDLPRSPSDGSLSTIDGVNQDKKDSRTSRLLKRMSNISSASRRSLAHALSPSRKEEPIIEHNEPMPEVAPSAAVDMGDVNIQFPDTLVYICSTRFK